MPHSILIVEDDQDLSDSIGDLFQMESPDYELFFADCIVEAQACAQENNIDIALIDIRLGADFGLDLIPILKDINPLTHCIVMTAFRDIDNVITALKKGADDYLLKPLDPELLINTINNTSINLNKAQLSSQRLAHMQSMFNSTPDVIILLDRNARLIDINDTALNYLSISREESLKKRLWELPWPHNKAVQMKDFFATAMFCQNASLEVDETCKLLEYNFSLTKKVQGNQAYFILEGKAPGIQQYIEHNLYKAAYTDALTGLHNRLSLEENFERLKQDALAKKEKIALIFIDLDNFKEINDHKGHKAGDEALKAVAQQLNNLSRNNDYVIRLGGDEFVILIPSLTTLHFIEGLAERIRKGINNAYEDEDNKITLSASIGVSIFPDNGNTLEKLMETADVAMYKAKKQGKNRFQFSRASNH